MTRVGTRTVHVAVPVGIDDEARPSGGNVYDRRLCQELRRQGWAVEQHAVDDVEPVLARLPEGGLVALGSAHGVLAHSERLRVVVLLHMPFGERAAEVRIVECLLLTAAAAVVVTSEWSRAWLLEHYPLRPGRVHVATPGADPAALAPGTGSGGSLLCVGAVAVDKGHAVLLAALAEVADLPWQLTCAGSLDLDRELVDRLGRLAAGFGIAGRVAWSGALSGARLEAAWAGTDALVLASRAESWGMVVGESLARGVPVLATEVGGLPEAFGSLPDGRRPGVLVPPGDAPALAGALRSWLTDEAVRRDLTAVARSRRTRLTGWPETAARTAYALEEAAR